MSCVLVTLAIGCATIRGNAVLPRGIAGEWVRRAGDEHGPVRPVALSFLRHASRNTDVASTPSARRAGI